MTWIIYALLPPFLWSVVNHTDKFLLSKKKHNSTVDVLMVYSTCFSFVIIPIVFLVDPSVLLESTLSQILVQIIGGLLLTFSIYFYLKALDKDEASIVVPFFQLVPVFGYVLSVFLLNEQLTPLQLFASFLILGGATILSMEFNEEKKFKIKHGILILMVASTLAQAIEEVMFKMTTLDQSFAASILWLHVGIAIFGMVLLATKRGLGTKFTESVKQDGVMIFSVNFASEGISSAAYIIRNFALLLAPTALVMAINGYQPIFVFVLGVLFTLMLPKFAVEKIQLQHLAHKAVAICIVFIGTILITSYSL